MSRRLRAMLAADAAEAKNNSMTENAKHSPTGASEASRCTPSPNDYAERALNEIIAVAVDNGEFIRGEARMVLSSIMGEAMTAAWQASFVAHKNRDSKLTCAHCGLEFPPGTPPSNHAALTDHGMVCPASPLVIRCNELVAALRDLRDACTDAYKTGRIPAEPFVRAGNVLDKVAP